MHTRASNSELVEPLPEPEFLNINYFRHFLDILRNYDPMDDEPMWAADHVVAPTPGSAITIPETTYEIAIKSNIIKIFYHGLSEITQKVLNAAAGGIFLYKTPNQAYRLLEDKVLLKLDWAKNQKTKSTLKKTVAFSDEGSSNSNTDKIIARMDAMTLKMDARYKELQTHAKKTKPGLDEDDIPMSREEEAKFMQTFRKTHFYNDYRDRDSNRDNWRSNERSSYNRDNYRSNTDDKPYDLQKQFNDFMKSQQSTNALVKETFMDLKTQLETVAKNHQASIQNLETKFDILADKQSGSLPSNTQPNPKGHNSKAYQPPQSRSKHVNDIFTKSGKSYNSPVNPNDQQTNSETPISFHSDDEDEEPTPQLKTQNPKPVKETPLPKPYKPKILIDGIDEILEEDFDALLDEGSKILHSIEGTLLENKILLKFDEFMAMTADENSDSESNTKDSPFKKITINTDYKIKTSIEEPPTDLELKPLPDNLEYVLSWKNLFLRYHIISLSKEKKNRLISVLKKHKQAFAWKTTDIPGICPSFLQT
ncbi:hypothetical protein Tco_0822549 [Tanacetum coccineum]|uniref:Reverse transcriptase domain-containing protein n=1 Tax=Tanacetum coccineum TaxID=301880 RepID=A0ABQ5AFG3_9ASTR